MSKLKLFGPWVTFLTILFTAVPTIVFALSPDPLNALAKAKIVLVGEMHFFTPTETYNYLFNQFSASPEPDMCLALEYPKSDKSFDEILNDLKKRADLIRVDPHPLSPQISRNFDMNFSYYGKINMIAKKHKFKVVTVEHFDRYNLDLSIDQRNYSISENLSYLLKEKNCSRILGIFGKVHLSLGMMRETTIQNFLQKSDIPSVTINLQMTNESGIDASMKAFQLSQLQAPMEKFIIIENSKLKQNVKLIPGVPGESSTWQNFDYTLLIPANLSPIAYPN